MYYTLKYFNFDKKSILYLFEIIMNQKNEREKY